MRHLLLNNVANIDDASVSYATPDQLPKAQIGVFDVASGANLDLTGANATAQMIIAQGVADGRTPVKSNILEKSKIAKVVTKAYEAPAKQITYVGFNGSDGDIENGVGDYLLKTVDVTNGYMPYPRMNANYHNTVAGATPLTIAEGIAKNAAGNDRFFVTVEVVSDLTTAAPATASTISVVKGTKTATLSDATSFSSGDYIRIGSADGASDPVYQIAALDGAAVTLNRTYVGDTNSAAVIGVAGSAPDSGTVAGLKLIGATPGPENGEGISIDTKDEVTAFRTAISEDFGTTEVRVAQTPNAGSGSYKQVEFLEKNTQASEGFFYRMTPFEAEKPEFFADPSLTYDLVTILYETNTTPNIAKSNKYLEIVLAFKAGELASASADLATFFGV